jgi:hypothetical protein
MVPVVLGLLAVLVVVWLFRRVLKILVWLAIALLIGVSIPGVVLGVLFLIARVGGSH